jgi:hypothetical protein
MPLWPAFVQESKRSACEAPRSTRQVACQQYSALGGQQESLAIGPELGDRTAVACGSNLRQSRVEDGLRGSGFQL